MGGTSVYMTFDGRKVKVYDPILSKKLCYSKPIPFSFDQFEITASASRFFIVGKPDSEPNFEIWFRVIDFDTIGSVPHMKKFRECQTDWKKSSAQMTEMRFIGGFKAHNLGENVIELDLWGYTDEATTMRVFYKLSYDTTDLTTKSISFH
jgi:hypothetical protein